MRGDCVIESGEPGMRVAACAAMSMPSLVRHMTKQPHTIQRTASLADAHALMRSNQIRHLPVLEGERLVGIVTQGDLHLLESIAKLELDSVEVGEAMTERPFIATSDMALDEALDIMREHKYGCAIVVGREGVEGIFTMVDACRVLADLLRRDALA